MDFAEWKTRFETRMNSLPPAFTTGEAWNAFKEFLHEKPGGNFEEELSFNAGLDTDAHAQPGRLFQVYFGRLIDRIGPGAWRTLEVNLYLRFDFSPNLGSVLTEGDPLRFETVVHSGAVSDREDFVQQVEGLTALWQALDGRIPTGHDFQFFVW